MSTQVRLQSVDGTATSRIRKELHHVKTADTIQDTTRKCLAKLTTLLFQSSTQPFAFFFAVHRARDLGPEVPSETAK